MGFRRGYTPPNKGKITTTAPIKDASHVKLIKQRLANKPRELALFTLGINTAFRAGELLTLKIGDLHPLPDGRIEILTRERKTSKLRRVIVNAPTSKTIIAYLQTRVPFTNDDYLFVGQRGRLHREYFAWMVKQWTKDLGLRGNFATHSLRKTWTHTMHVHHDVPLSTLMYALGHSSERQTLQYVGLLQADVQKVYDIAV